MNDFLIFLVLAGVALVFRWLTKQAAEQAEKNESSEPNERPVRPPSESEEERVRRFLEALGVPPGTRPPPPVKPRSVQPRRVATSQPPPPRKVRRSLVQPLPPLVTTPEAPTAPPPVTTVPVEPRPLVETRPETFVSPPSEALVSPVETVVRQRRRPSTPAQAPPQPPTSLVALLRTRNSVRQAVILREVLGPPRGLQSLAQFDHA
jgi:hypothetical protein